MSTEIATVQPAVMPAQRSAALDCNPRQISFVDNYMECRILWRSAQLAGYSGDMQTLAVTANDLLKNPKVYAYYVERLQALQCTPDETLAEIGMIAKSPWEKHVEVKYSESGEVVGAQLKLADKLKALELAGKYHKLFTDRTESEVTLSDDAIEKLGESLFTTMLAAAEKKRAAQAVAPVESP